MSTHHSGSTGVMSIRGGAPKGKDVGLAMTSSGVRDLSPWRHDSGGSCRLPEKRRLPRRRSTPSVQDGDVKDSLRQQSEDSLVSWEEAELGLNRNSATVLHSSNILIKWINLTQCWLKKNKPNHLFFVSTTVWTLGFDFPFPFFLSHVHTFLPLHFLVEFISLVCAMRGQRWLRCLNYSVYYFTL